MKKSIVILGPAHPYRPGGITTFNERLAKAFQDEGHDVTIYNFTLQYPSFLFPGKTQYSNDPAPKDLKILRKVNSVNPFNWLSVGNELKKLRPDIILVRFWLPLMGPALGTICRKAKKNGHTKIIAITDNVLPHEKRPGDKPFTTYFLNSCDAFVTMSDKVMNDLKQFVPLKKAIKVEHPLYDSFGDIIAKDEARKKLGLDQQATIMLFFGFIRKYKGLDLLLEAISILKKQSWNPINPNSTLQTPNWQLVIAGEFYDDKEKYEEQIKRLDIADKLVLKTDFIPNDEVRYYFGAADVVIQPYKNATQSGVTPLAYHFEKPMIVTNVGALPDYVPHEKVGLVSTPDAASIAKAIEHYFALGEQSFLPHLREEKKKYLWEVLVKRIFELAE